MNYFQKKLNNQKDFIYENYLKLLKNNNTDLKSDLDQIIDTHRNYLTKFIEDFYEIIDIFNINKYNNDIEYDYSNSNPIMDEINKKKREIQEKKNKMNWDIGLENYSVIIFDYFPIEIVKKIIQYYVDNKIYNSYINIEIKKFLYSHWKDDLVKDIVQQITDILIETANFTKEEYLDIMSNPKNQRYNFKKHYIYYVFWLYFFYPLIEGYEELIIKLVNIVHLEDAQDELLNGIELIESTKLLVFYKKFILEVWKSCNYRGTMCFDLFNTATGSFGQNVRIIKKLKKDLGWNIFTDDDLQDFLNDNLNSLNIQYIKKDLEENHDDLENLSISDE
jgi:hypothetical protein